MENLFGLLITQDFAAERRHYQQGYYGHFGCILYMELYSQSWLSTCKSTKKLLLLLLPGPGCGTGFPNSGYTKLLPSKNTDLSEVTCRDWDTFVLQSEAFEATSGIGSGGLSSKNGTPSTINKPPYILELYFFVTISSHVWYSYPSNTIKLLPSFPPFLEIEQTNSLRGGHHKVRAAGRPRFGARKKCGYIGCTCPVLAPGAILLVSDIHMCAATSRACFCTFQWNLPPSSCRRASGPALPGHSASHCIASLLCSNPANQPVCAHSQRRSQLNSSRKGRTMPRAAQQPSVGVAPLPPESDLDVPFHERDILGGSLLASHQDHYEGVIVDPVSLPPDVDTFKRMLELSLAAWRVQQRKGVWLKLPAENANLVAPAIEAGFAYHHAEPSYVMLTYWIPDTPSTLPANASHQVGIGAFVMNDREEVLAVQEKNGILKNTGLWKMPTGLINQAEDICSGAIREVKEETGIDAEFVEIVGFRQGHQVAFEKSDLFFVCILRPLSSKIVKQESEIAAAEWMPLEDFYAQPLVQKRGVLKQMLDVCVAQAKGRYRGFSLQTLPSSQDQYNFYSGILDPP